METLFLVPACAGFNNVKAAIDLLRECYGVKKSALAPMGIGLICETVKPVPEEDQRTLGIIPWL